MPEVIPDTEGEYPSNKKLDTNSSEIARTLLRIISEKTGYPEEMLELNMDMEADLGIDSIKRVEIMWAFQEGLPSLPQVSGNDIGELRTLQEIINHLELIKPEAVIDKSSIPFINTETQNSEKKNS